MMDAYEAGNELDAVAKNLMQSHHVTYSQALRMAVAANPKLGTNYTGFKIPPGGFEQVYRQQFARRRGDTMQVKIYSQGPEHDGDNGVHTYGYSLIDDVVSEAKRAVAASGGDVSLPTAVLQILRTRPATCKKIAGGWLDAQARLAVNNESLNKGPTLRENYGPALARVRAENPSVDQMYQTGRVSMDALKTCFPQWYRS